MSLRYSAPAGNFFFKEKDPLVPLPSLDAPAGTEFRRGDNLKTLVAGMLGKKNHVLTASPGSGKSTVLPLEFAKVHQYVVVLTPGHTLASSNTLQAIKQRKPGDPAIKFAPAVVKKLHCGLTYMSYATMLASIDCGLDVSEVCILADESHENDCYTYVAKVVIPRLKPKSFIQLSATPSVKYEMREAGGPGRVVDTGHWFSALPSDWSRDDSFMPWAYGGSFAYFCDDVATRESAREVLLSLGYEVAEMDGHTDPADFLRNKFRLDKQERSIAWILDSTFRSGHTLDFDVIVDSGLISEPGCKPAFRELSSAERLQTMHRIGRTRQGDFQYHCNRASTGAGFRLVGAEREFAAYLFRVFGFVPPQSFGDCLMTRAKLKESLVKLKVWAGGTPVDQYCYKADGSLHAGVQSLPEREGSPEPLLEPTLIVEHNGRVTSVEPRMRETRRALDETEEILRTVDPPSGECARYFETIVTRLNDISDRLRVIESNSGFNDLNEMILSLRAELKAGRTVSKQQNEALMAMFTRRLDEAFLVGDKAAQERYKKLSKQLDHLSLRVAEWVNRSTAEFAELVRQVIRDVEPRSLMDMKSSLEASVARIGPILRSLQESNREKSTQFMATLNNLNSQNERMYQHMKFASSALNDMTTGDWVVREGSRRTGN